MRSRWFYLGLCYCLIQPLEAKDIDVSVVVNRIEQMQFLEDDSDHLYFYIGESLAKRDYFHYQIPTFPDYWSSLHLGTVKNLRVWKNRISEGKEDNIEVALMDRRFGPDTYVGGIRLRFVNKGGELLTEWNKNATGIEHKVINNDIHTVTFASDKNQYKVHFQVSYAMTEDKG